VTTSTHSAMAKALLDHERRLAEILPRAGAGPIVSDATSRQLIRSAAEALLEMDRKLGELTIQVRELRYQRNRKELAA
jgi:hypothetical protein